MGTQFVRRAAAPWLLALAFGSAAGTARAIGPTGPADWHDGVIDPKAVVPGTISTSLILRGVHGRSRPDAVGMTNTSYVFAVGDAGTILFYNGTSWSDLTSKNPASGVNLRAVYIFPSNVSLGGGNLAAGFAVGDGGTIIQILENTPLTFTFTCVNCPGGGCGAGGGGPLNVCATLFDIFPVDKNSAATSLFVVGQSMTSPPDSAPPNAFGGAAANGPSVLFWSGTAKTWYRLTGGASIPPGAPYTVSAGIWPSNIQYNAPLAVTHTGLITKSQSAAAPTAGGAIDSFGTHQDLVFTGSSTGVWTRKDAGNAICPPAFYSGTTFAPSFEKAIMFGNWAIVGGDVDSCFTFPSYLQSKAGIPGNLYAWNQNDNEPLRVIDTGLTPVKADDWGSIRGLDALPSWGFGVGVGCGAVINGADFNDVQNGSANSGYYAKIDWTDPVRLPFPEDPFSANTVSYWDQHCLSGTCVGLLFGEQWPGALYDVFLSAYNEGWAVGDRNTGYPGNQIVHWVGPTVPAARLVSTLSAGPPGPWTAGQWVEIVFTVTNVGVSPPATPAGAANFATALALSPPSMMTLVGGPVCTATYFSCPTSLPGGGSVSFTWTYSVNGCALNAAFTATATGNDLLFGGSLVSATRMTLSSGVLSTSVWSSHAPAAPAPGGVVTYTLTIRNSGSATITGLTIIDTAPAALFNPSGTAGPFTLTVTATGASTTVLIWSGVPPSLPPGGTQVVSWTGTLPSCAGATLNNRFTVLASASCGTPVLTQSVANGDVYTQPGSAGLSLTAAVAHAPPAPTLGASVGFSITVTNTGSPTITGLEVWDTVPSSVFLTSAPAPPGFTVAIVPAGSSTLVVWTGTGLSFTGGSGLTFDWTADLVSPCSGTATNRATARATGSCGAATAVSPVDTFTLKGALDVGMVISSKIIREGLYTVTVAITVTNTGNSWVNNLRPPAVLTLTPNVGDTVLQQSPVSSTSDVLSWLPSGTCTSPPGCPTLAIGCAATFLWVYQSSATNPVTFSGAIQADVCPTPPPLCDIGCTAQGGNTCSVSAAATTWFADSGEAGEFTIDRNLFRGRTEKVTAAWQIKETGDVEVTVYNSIGQKIKTLWKGVSVRRLPYSVQWDGRNEAGERVASGAYYIKLESSHLPKTRKVALVK